MLRSTRIAAEEWRAGVDSGGDVLVEHLPVIRAVATGVPSVDIDPVVAQAVKGRGDIAGVHILGLLGGSEEPRQLVWGWGLVSEARTKRRLIWPKRTEHVSTCTHWTHFEASNLNQATSLATRQSSSTA